MKRKGNLIWRLAVALIFVLSMGLTMAVPAAAAGPAITLTPSSGAPGTTITITGTGFANSTPGWIWFDSNLNNVRDTTETFLSVTTTATGEIPANTKLTVPVLLANTYPVQADIPSGGAPEASNNFAVVAGITLTPSTGGTGTVINITGAAFAATATGWIWFDSNNNNVLDTTETSLAVTTTAAGEIPAGTTLTVPAITVGNYYVQADIPTTGVPNASAIFSNLGSISLDKSSGAPGTQVTISGGGFMVNAIGQVWFDIDKDGTMNGAEVAVAVTTTASGAIPAGIKVTVPSVPTGSYKIQADIPTGGIPPPEASAAFAVFPAITLTPDKGVPGTVFRPQKPLPLSQYSRL